MPASRLASGDPVDVRACRGGAGPPGTVIGYANDSSNHVTAPLCCPSTAMAANGFTAKASSALGHGSGFDHSSGLPHQWCDARSLPHAGVPLMIAACDRLADATDALKAALIEARAKLSGGEAMIAHLHW